MVERKNRRRLPRRPLLPRRPFSLVVALDDQDYQFHSGKRKKILPGQ